MNQIKWLLLIFKIKKNNVPLGISFRSIDKFNSIIQLKVGY